MLEFSQRFVRVVGRTGRGIRKLFQAFERSTFPYVLILHMFTVNSFVCFIKARNLSACFCFSNGMHVQIVCIITQPGCTGRILRRQKMRTELN